MDGGLLVPQPLAPLEELYRCVLSANCPSLTPAHSARLLRSCLCAHGDGVSALEHGCESASAPELCYVSLTVLELLLGRLTAGRGAQEFRLFAEETWGLIQSDVTDALLQQLHSEDQLLSHLCVMCVSAAVLYQLNQNGVVSPQWCQWCVQALRSPPSPCVDACVRALTEVLRRLLKGAQHELTEKVLTAFDSSLSAFCSQFLSVDREAASGSRRQGATVCLFIDLLEVLCACRSACGDGTPLSGPCLLCVHASELLALCSCPLLQPPVRKRVLLLLKRALVQKVGEDWTGGHQGPGCSDVRLLAVSVLRAAAEGWVRGVHVEGTSYFGGTRTVRSGVRPNVDSVTLRAACLILLKSMELQCQTDGPEPVPIDLCLQSLWDVLRRVAFSSADPLVLPSGLPRHGCSWLSTVFGEQDDDMMEAAKALLCIFLHHRQQEPALSPTHLQFWACSFGLNPHCHFLLLLRSLAFDHRVLLDFLISTETCFLEYCVRYLRFLRMDPEGFSAACTGLCPELPQSRTANLGTGGAGGVSLVDYTSSGESDTEMAMSRDCERAEPRCVKLTNSQGPCLESAVRCLCQLRAVVSRLHKKKLFPYNPISLIKLLTEVEASMKPLSAK